MSARDPWLLGLQPLWLAGLVPAVLRLEAARRQPEAAQARLLRQRVRALAGSDYGRRYLGGVDSVASFQRKVPVVDHDALMPFIERIAAGEARVLSTEPVTLFERSGGSTRTTTKLIPYTAGLLSDFAAATNPWLFDLFRRHPTMLGRPAYWSLSPVAQGVRRTAGGIPIGMADDTAYFGPLRRFVIARSLAVPGRVAQLTELAAWRTETLVHLVRARHLGFISVWSPTFLLVLMQHLARDPDAVLARLTSERAREVAAALREPGAGRAIWPGLAVISTWADGPSAAFIAALAAWFPGVAIEPKGLLATEGVVSIPFGAPDPQSGAGTPGALIALTSHFLEWIDLARPDARPRLSHELEVGGEYSPLLTTGGGLVRYHLKDVVRCEAPLRVRFLGKLDQVADLAGEKVHARQVERALEGAKRRLGIDWEFVLLAPVDGAEAVREGGEKLPPAYVLFIDTRASDVEVSALARAVEEHLFEGHAYRYCRELGQLGPMRVQRVHEGRARWLEALVARGQRLGEVKSTVLDGRMIWGPVFGQGKATETAEE
ncbi:MAG: GH3 auxin-responsive promoter family protein, partial [Deltaproteobacteria bacterium]|nr:GH3 auxin-responsive promoter family protein [Deltaproteobacteria bacterium]